MKLMRTIHRAVDVVINLAKVLGGNWPAVFSLAASTIELYAVLREPAVA